MLRGQIAGRAQAYDSGSAKAGVSGPTDKPSASAFVSPFRSSKAALRVKLYGALVVADALALIGAFVCANLVRFGTPLTVGATEVLIILLPIYLTIAFHSRAYAIDVLLSPKAGVRRSLQSLAIAVAVVIGTFFYMKASADFSRIAMAVGTGASVALLAAGRLCLGHLAGTRHNWCFTNEVIFVDDVPVLPTRGQIVVFAEQAQLTPTVSDPVLLDRLGHLLKNCDRVVLACPADRRRGWAAMMKGIDVNVEMMAPELDDLGALGMGRVGHRSTVLVSHGPMSFRNQITKRALDLLIAVPVLALAAPLMALIAIAIKIDSKGPVFFRQARMGQGNRVFNILKFRSMRADLADRSGTRSASRDDERITRVGAFLRRTSLDELPQLINVLIGNMSIVGPRPHALGSTAEDLLFWNIDPQYWDRHVIKPGITGLAQVRGFRGATAVRTDLSNRLQADLEYVTGWSLWRDIGIVFATAKVLLHRNAF
jgi:exopolysaccharide biosynthesis polyprenyl glycosylphosphotransferase